MIPHSCPTLGREEAEQVSQVISSGYIAQDKKVDEFEKRFARFLGLKKTAAVNSGTSALHLALIAIGVKTRDEVILPSFVCTALLNAVNYIGGVPVVADIDEKDFNISFEDTVKRITKKTKAIIIPHMSGIPCGEIYKLKDTGIPIIEDCAQSIGAKVMGKNVGTIGDISIFSFYATKVMTTGEGGMVAGSSDDLIDSVIDLTNYDNRDDYKVRYNYKMTDIQAVMGIEQLKKLPDFISRRRIIAERYNEGFKDLPIRVPVISSGVECIWFRYVIYSEKAKELIGYLKEKGICAVKPIFKPLHLLLDIGQEDYPVSERVWHNTVSLPIYPLLSDENVSKIIEHVRLFYFNNSIQRK